MAQNRRPEAEAQPESSSEEDEGSSEESEDQDDNDLTPMSKKPFAPKKPEGTPTSAHPQSSSNDGSESESESESDSPPTIARRTDPNIKPIASKPMEETPKATKKPRSEPTSSTLAAKSSATAIKRPVERQNDGDRDSKRAKKKKTADAADGGVNNDTAKKNADDARRQLFQRLWSEEDEIVILKGMIEYRAKKGSDPVADLNAFHDFIKKSLHVVDVSKTQFSTKVRRLKKKYENNLAKGKNGQDRSFSNPHEQKTYELSKKIWGCGEANGVEVENTKASGKGKKNQKVSPNEDGLASPDRAREGTRREVESNTGLTWSSRFDRSIVESSLEEVIMKDGLELISGPKKLELQEKWKQFRVEEVELYLKRLELIREQTKLVLDTLKSPGH